MFCPYCGAYNSDGSEACQHCHGRFPVKEAQAVLPQPKKGRVWPSLLALLLMFAVGLGLFFAVRFSTGTVTDPEMPWFSVSDSTLYFDESKYTGGEELTVPSSIGGQPVLIISEKCFMDCRMLTTVHLPEGLRAIRPQAFAGCSSLRSMKLPESITFIGDAAFLDCSALEAICLPYSAQRLGHGIFYGCERLTHIFYPATMELWQELEIDSIGPNTSVYCVDGVIRGGEN